MNNNQPLVTIGIPTYNRADKFLISSLKSALCQTYKNIEIIVSDNCSTDNTESIVKDLTDPRVRYTKHPHNIGANNNFNYCIEQARGQYFLLLPADDLIDEDFIETCMNAVDGDTEVGIIRTGTRVVNGLGEIQAECLNPAKGLSTEDFLLAWFNNEITLYLCSTLFNTKRLKEIGGLHSTHNLFQDVVTEVKLLSKYGRVDAYDIKASFCRHDENIGSAAKVLEWCEDSAFLLDTIIKSVSDNYSLIKKNGSIFLSKKVYGHATNIKSPIKRFYMYIIVYRTFGYQYSPVRYLYNENIRPILYRLRNKFKK